jgi:hypothetical protein
MSKFLLISILFLNFLIVSHINASIIQFDYLVTGVIEHYNYESGNYTDHDLNGILGIKQKAIIDEVGCLPNENSRQIHFQNEIPYYEFSIEKLGSFTGNGILSSIYYNYDAVNNSNSSSIDNSFTCGMDELILDGDLPWRIWSMNVDFFDQNGNAYNKYGPPTDYYSLPSSISLKQYALYNGFFIKSLNFTSVTIVPETNTNILSIFAIIIYAVFLIFGRCHTNNTNINDIE